MRASQALALMNAELADPKTSAAQRARLRKGIAAYISETSPERQAQQARMGMIDNTGSKITMKGGTLSFSTMGGEHK